MTRSVRPTRLAQWTDPSRGLVELATLAAFWPLLPLLPRGNGHPVLVLPGLATDDTFTVPLRALLRHVGYEMYGWELGRNIGPTRRALVGMRTRLDSLSTLHGQPVSLVGWSLGGIFARQLARRTPDQVRQVITLGSPFQLEGPGHSNARRVYDRYAHQHVETLAFPLERGEGPLPVPTTSIYSRLDGIVPWQACLNEPSATAENIEVYASHFGFGHHPAAVWAVADRLAQPEGTWAPFRPPPLLRVHWPARRRDPTR